MCDFNYLVSQNQTAKPSNAPKIGAFFIGPMWPEGRLMLICLDCDWKGYAFDLVRKTTAPDDNDFNYCPDCESDNIEEEEEEPE